MLYPHVFGKSVRTSERLVTLCKACQLVFRKQVNMTRTWSRTYERLFSGMRTNMRNEGKARRLCNATPWTSFPLARIIRLVHAYVVYNTESVLLIHRKLKLLHTVMNMINKGGQVIEYSTAILPLTRYSIFAFILARCRLLKGNRRTTS